MPEAEQKERLAAVDEVSERIQAVRAPAAAATPMIIGYYYWYD